MVPHDATLVKALRRLGFTPYTLRTAFHGTNVRSHPEKWANLLSGREAVSNLNFLSNYDCLVGPPSAVLYNQVLKCCPPYTKVILIQEQHKTEWAETLSSFTEGLTVKESTLFYRLLFTESRVRTSFMEMLSTMTVGPPRIQSKQQPPFTGSEGERAQLTRKSHVKAVQQFELSVTRSIPPHRLLVYDLREGWSSLCRFLEKEVPAEEFPSPTDGATSDFGLEVLKAIDDRLEKVQLLQKTVKAMLLAILICFFSPYLVAAVGSGKTAVNDYSVAYGGEANTTSP